MQRLIVFCGVAMACLAAPAMARGQAGNHWSEQYGNRSMLLNGAVIGSVSDLGLVFYNPGRLGLVDDLSFVLTARAYQWDSYRLENGLGEGVDLEDTRFGRAPTLASGGIILPFLEGHRFAYAFLTRRRDDLDAFLRTERSGDLFDQIPGNEYFTGSVEIANTLKEDWIGLTWAHTLGEHWSLGLSTFYYNLSRRTRLATDLRGLTEANDVMVMTQERAFTFRDEGLIWKAGLAGILHPVSLGFTVTAPRVSAVAEGRIQYEDLVTGLDATTGESAESVLIENVQSGLPAVTRSPWAVGAGVGVEWGRATIHLSGEWYSAVPKYTVTEARTFQGQSTGEPMEYRVVEELESVFNGAVGIEWQWHERFSLFGSFASNRSTTPEDRSSILDVPSEVSTTAIRTDYLQWGGGFEVTTDYFGLDLGLSHSWASDDLKRPIMFPDQGYAPVYGAEEDVRFVASRWRFLLGISFPFLDRLSGMVGGGGRGDGDG